jgi:hypothetical protein
VLGSAAALAHPPYGLVVDAGGNAYFSDLEAVWRLAPDGRLTLFRPGEEGVHVHELVLAADGSVEGDVNGYDAATQTYSSAIWRRSPDGRERWVLAPTSAPPKGIGTWQDRAGNRYTAQWPSHEDRRTMLFRRSADGRVDLLDGPADKAAPFREVIVSSVGAMAFPAGGGPVFADGARLRRARPNGAVATLYQGPAGTDLRGVSLAADGRILVADAGRSLVLAVAPDGRAESLFHADKAWLPTAAAEAPGRLLVLEANADPYDYVRRMRLVELRGGKARVVAEPWKGPSGRAAPAEAAPTAETRRHGGGGAVLAAVAAVTAAAAIMTGLVLLRRRRTG